jgi:hypothetical protein
LQSVLPCSSHFSNLSMNTAPHECGEVFAAVAMDISGHPTQQISRASNTAEKLGTLSHTPQTHHPPLYPHPHTTMGVAATDDVGIQQQQLRFRPAGAPAGAWHHTPWWHCVFYDPYERINFHSHAVPGMLLLALGCVDAPPSVQLADSSPGHNHC